MIRSAGTAEEGPNDLTTVDCREARELLSGHMDDSAALPQSVQSHLLQCDDCRSWQQRAHTLSRRLMALAASPNRMPADLPMPRRFWLMRAARLSLAWIGALLIAFNLPDLFAGGIDIELIHLTRHQSAFSMALGASFLFVAWRPDRAYGMVPIAAVFAVMISGATIDLINGASTLEREAIHLAEIGGLAIVWLLGVAAGPGRGSQGGGTLTAVED